MNVNSILLSLRDGFKPKVWISLWCQTLILVLHKFRSPKWELSSSLSVSVKCMNSISGRRDSLLLVRLELRFFFRRCTAWIFLDNLLKLLIVFPSIDQVKFQLLIFKLMILTRVSGFIFFILKWADSFVLHCFNLVINCLNNHFFLVFLLLPLLRKDKTIFPLYMVHRGSLPKQIGFVCLLLLRVIFGRAELYYLAKGRLRNWHRATSRLDLYIIPLFLLYPDFFGL